MHACACMACSEGPTSDIIASVPVCWCLARLDRCHGLSYSIRLLIDGRLRSGCSDAAAEGQGIAKAKGGVISIRNCRILDM